MHTKSTLLTTYTIADMGDAEKEFAMVRHKVTKFDFLPLSCKCHGKEKANSFVVVVATEIQERDFHFPRTELPSLSSSNRSVITDHAGAATL